MKKAAATRLDILRKAYDLIYANGYLNTSIDNIIATTQVTKGAFYYHFKNKEEMGLAIINEVLKPAFNDHFMAPLENEPDPAAAIYQLIARLLLKTESLKVEYGCPVGNLAHELAPWHADFQQALQELVGQWTKAMTSMIERGKKNGFIRANVNAKQVTLFVISGYWGIRHFGQIANSKQVYQPYLKELKSYLETLK